MIVFKKAISKDDYLQIEALADVIWRDHYIPMVGKAQIDYMLHNFQSASAIEKQIATGLDYYLLIYNQVPIGYVAIKKEAEALFLSKIYVLKDYRGKNIGKETISFVEEKAKIYQLSAIRLTVNINNESAIAFYKKAGFIISRPLVADIGNGFVMDDYEMLKLL